MSKLTSRLFLQHRIRETSSLDGDWVYVFPREGHHIELAEVEDGVAHLVKVPCAWESLESYVNYRGEAIARRTFVLRRDAAIRLAFKGVSHSAIIFLDGVEVGRHHNAYTPFAVLLTDCRAGEHVLEVHMSNRHGKLSALHVPNDYYNYGGITRPVQLQVLRSSVSIEHLFLTPSRVHDEWEAKVRIVLQNNGEAVTADLTLSLRQNMEDGPLTTHRFENLQIASGRSELFCVLKPSEVLAWAPEHPELYFVEAVLEANDGPMDDLIERIGFRTVEVCGERILINSEPIFFKGFNRHEDHPAYGCALPREAMKKDLALLREANGNAVRTSHYPNDERFLDLCDELGVLVWEENHARGLSLEQMRHARFQEQCAKCNDEMVTAHFNHPSIVIWGILNECASHTEDGRQVYAEQFEQILTLDPSRPTTFASCQHGGDLCQDLPAICSWNTYYNWYENRRVAEALEDTIRQREAEGMQGKPFIMSEFGAGAIPGYSDPIRRAKWSEERQADLLDEYLEVLLAHPRLCGVFIWQFCDIRVDESLAMQRPRTMNNKGIVDEYRRKKRAFKVVKDRYGED